MEWLFVILEFSITLNCGMERFFVISGFSDSVVSAMYLMSAVTEHLFCAENFQHEMISGI